MPATAGTKQDPTDMYLEALRLVTQAAGLVEKRDYIGAIRLTQQAEDKFGRLAKSYPQWRPNLLQTRRQLNRENLDQWQKLAQQQAAAEGKELERERRRQQAMLAIKKKFGKNAIIKGMDLQEGATAMERNAQIGGHKA